MHHSRHPHHPLRHQLRLIRGGKPTESPDAALSNWKDDAFLRAHYLEKRPNHDELDRFTFLSAGNGFQPGDDEDFRG